MTTLTSIVLPVYEEGEAVTAYLERLLEEVTAPREILVIHDMPEDSTVPVVERYADSDVRAVLNTYGRGPANAIRFGLDEAAGDVVVVTMADGSDDATQIDIMCALVRDGNAVVAASRYMRGGKQIGGPLLKSLISRIAGVSLYHLGRVGTRDATNSFKAYSAKFLRTVQVESSAGFEVGIELVAKARRRRLAVTEMPTVWRDRTEGESRFKLAQWFPRYLRWYLHAFGPRHRSATTTSAGGTS